MRSVDVGTQIVAADAVYGCVGGIGIESPGIHQRDFAPGRNTRRGHVFPRFTPVTRYLNKAVVGTGPDGVDVFIRRGHGINDPAPGHCFQGIGAVYTHVFGNVGVGLAGQIGADFLPGVPAVLRFE